MNHKCFLCMGCKKCGRKYVTVRDHDISLRFFKCFSWNQLIVILNNLLLITSQGKVWSIFIAIVRKSDRNVEMCSRVRITILIDTLNIIILITINIITGGTDLPTIGPTADSTSAFWYLLDLLGGLCKLLFWLKLMLYRLRSCYVLYYYLTRWLNGNMIGMTLLDLYWRKRDMF